MHASAVQLEKGILIFLGNSGTGMSTLAGVFHQAGQPAISDDVIWVKEDQTGEILVIPSYDGLRLWDDSLKVIFSEEQNILPMAHYSLKKRVLFSSRKLFPGGPALAMIVLNPTEKLPSFRVHIELLSRRDAFMEIMDETFQLDSLDFEARNFRMQIVGRIVLKLPVYHLSMPQDYAVLPMVRQKILEAVM